MKFRFVYWIYSGILLLAILFLSCAEDITGQKNQNLPPETTVFVQADTLNLTPSIQTIFWDGRDADGFITGFYYTWEINPGPNDWIWTTERSETFPLQITGQDTSYQFQVKAVDNDAMEDPSPAVQIFPIKNSPPTISWTNLSQIPDTTFTVASFVWNASDLDGDTTILFFEYALDSPTNWRTIPGTRRQVTLNADSGLTVGPHAFYIRAVDIAGARSSTIRMPEDSTAFFIVRSTQGRYLLIDDFLDESFSSSFPDAFYKALLDTLLPEFGEQYSYWNIEEQYPSSVIQFTETLKLFDRIIWYTDFIEQSDPHFIGAQVAIPQFRSIEGKKIIYTVKFNEGFGSQGDPLDFSPVDSLGAGYRILSNSDYYPDSNFQNTFPNIQLPQLKSSNPFVLFGMLAFVPKATSVPMYRFDDPQSTDDPLFVLIGFNDNFNYYDFLISGTPLNQLNGNNNIDEFFRTVIQDIFEP